MTAAIRRKRLLDTVDQLTTCPTESALAVAAPRAIVSLIGADVAAFTRIDVRNRTARLDLYPDAPKFTAPTRQTGATLGDNPVVCHWSTGIDPAPRRVSDLVGRREWRRTSTFANVLGPMGTPHLVGIPLYRSTTGGPSYAIARSGRDFTDDDLSTLGAIQAALVVLHRRFQPLRSAHDPVTGELSSRELEVLALLAQGLSGRQVAHRLGLALGTVRKHLERIYAKLGVHDRMNAVIAGQERGLIRRPPG